MKYAAKKVLTLIITLFIVSLLAFLAFQIIPGDPTTKPVSYTHLNKQGFHSFGR